MSAQTVLVDKGASVGKGEMVDKGEFVGTFVQAGPRYEEGAWRWRSLAGLLASMTVCFSQVGWRCVFLSSSIVDVVRQSIQDCLGCFGDVVVDETISRTDRRF